MAAIQCLLSRKLASQLEKVNGWSQLVRQRNQFYDAIYDCGSELVFSPRVRNWARWVMINCDDGIHFAYRYQLDLFELLLQCHVQLVWLLDLFLSSVVRNQLLVTVIRGYLILLACLVDSLLKSIFRIHTHAYSHFNPIQHFVQFYYRVLVETARLRFIATIP